MLRHASGHHNAQVGIVALALRLPSQRAVHLLLRLRALANPSPGKMNHLSNLARFTGALSGALNISVADTKCYKLSGPRMSKTLVLW